MIHGNGIRMGEHVIEAIDSLKAFSSHIGAALDYSIGINPNRVEYISFNVSDDLTLGDVTIELDLSGNCPFTGCYYDEVILDVFRDSAYDANSTLVQVLNNVESNVLKAVHDENYSLT